MFKKKDSNSLKVSGKISKSTANDLALVIARMQKNSDQVEKNVLRAEELLAVDAENEKKNRPLQHQKVVASNLSEAEGLLNDLFLDVDKAKKCKHPQSSEIESDVSHLHDRWLKDCAFYREIYEPVNDVELKPRIDWASVLNQKQREVNTEEYGPTMADLKKQIAAHNILHKEIEAYSSQLSSSSTSTKEEYAAIKKQYNNLLDNSKWRHHYLSSLYDYMQGCNKELAYLGDEQTKILKQDWSDHMLDPPDVRRQYENFKNNSLLSHESEVNKLQDDGDRLIELKHPASTPIQAQRDSLRNEWQKFLNLCICQETHLDYIEDFKKYQLDVETLSESLSELNSSLKKVEGSTGRSGSAMTLQLEAEESTVQRNEQLLADLRKRSTTIAPLKLRRYPPTRSTTVDSLCDWKTEKVNCPLNDSAKKNLNATRPNIREKVMKKEVIRLEKDPEMLKAVKTFEKEIADEGHKSKTLNDEIFQTRSQINALERIIPTIQPKMVTREVKKVEQDPELINESKRIRSGLEGEKIETDSLVKEVSQLKIRYSEVGQWKPKVELKEIVNEIYRIDPQTELEIMRLKKDVQDLNKQRSDLQDQITLVMVDLEALRSKKPKVELKEVIQDVVKEERSPENEREIQRLNDQVNHLHHTYNNVEDQINLLRKERDEWKAEKSKVETKLTTKDIFKYEDDPLLEKEADRLRKEVREEQQCRRTTEEMVFDLQNKYIQLERQKPEEKVVVQEVVRLQKDPKQIVEHDKLGRSLDEEVKSRRQLELEMQKLKTLVEEKENILKQSDEHQRKIKVEFELKQIKLRIKELENAPPPVEESIVVEEVLKVERDPRLERMTNGLRSDMDKETNDVLNIQRNIRNTNVKLELLQREKAIEKTVYKEVIRVEKDQAVEAERYRLKGLVSQEKHARQDLEEKIKQLSDKLNRLNGTQSSTSREETSLILARDTLQREKDNLTRELKKLESERQDISVSFQQQTKLMSERSQINRQKSVKMESDVQRLEREILDEKDTIHQKDNTIRELQRDKEKEDHTETRTKETNVSTKITILDPDTGKELSPYEAYLQGLIDRTQYMHLQELECDWEEITSMGPDGETSVLQDRKSGKQYSIKNALRDGKLTQYDLQKYKDGKMPISEFALLVAGEKEKQPKFNSITSKPASSLKSSPTSSAPVPAPKERYPIAGVIDTNTDTCVSIRSAVARKLIESGTAQKLLEAQAATGGIIDISTQERYSVHKAAERGLIDSSQLQRLLNAQKAYTGVEDPTTRERLSVGEAVLKGWMPKETALRYMEVQHLTGGLVNPNNTDRVGIQEAIGNKMIDSTMMRELQDEYNYAKEIVDPTTKDKINYKQAMARCKTDPQSGLLMLPASSKVSGSSYTPTYNSHRFSSR
ncbi:envoplakin-like [Salvelinus sp. IW2-2015]|uniref:envoplakin-like n=1 Tax=Salvelinus sp. IW2-2015 TaxID=2691554 RepID=UPI0038D455B0